MSPTLSQFFAEQWGHLLVENNKYVSIEQDNAAGSSRMRSSCPCEDQAYKRRRNSIPFTVDQEKILMRSRWESAPHSPKDQQNSPVKPKRRRSGATSVKITPRSTSIDRNSLKNAPSPPRRQQSPQRVNEPLPIYIPAIF